MKFSRIRRPLYPNHPFVDRHTAQPRRQWLPRRLLLVRHGESIANVDREVYSNTPDWRIPLTARGREQARDCGRRLRQIVGDEQLYIYYSPYERTKQTLHEIRKSFSDDQIQGEREDERLREQEIGNYQPMRSMDSYWADRANFSRLYYRFPDGESSADVGDRVSAFFDSLLRERLGLSVPNMNDTFSESKTDAIDLSLVREWDGYSEEAAPSQSLTEVCEGDGGAEENGTNAANMSTSAVHARWRRENGDAGVAQPLEAAGSTVPASASASAPGQTSTQSMPPRAATCEANCLDEAEASAVCTRWMQEKGDTDIPRRATSGKAPATSPTHKPAASSTAFSPPPPFGSRRSLSTPSMATPSSRWRNGSGPAGLPHQPTMSDGNPHATFTPLTIPAPPDMRSPHEQDGEAPSADDQNVIIVSHGLLIRLFIGRWFRVPMEVFETMSNPPNCAIVVLERDETHERLVMTEISKSLFGSDPLLQMMKFDGNEDTQWYRERFLGIVDPELSPHGVLGEDDDENHYSLSTKHNSAVGAPVPHPRPLVSREPAATTTSASGTSRSSSMPRFTTGARKPDSGGSGASSPLKTTPSS